MAILRVKKTNLVGADYSSPSSSLGLLSLFLMSSGRQLEFALNVHTCEDGPNPDSLLREVVPPWCHVEVEFSCLLDRVFDFLMEASNRPPLTFGIGRRLIGRVVPENGRTGNRERIECNVEQSSTDCKFHKIGFNVPILQFSGNREEALSGLAQRDRDKILSCFFPAKSPVNHARTLLSHSLRVSGVLHVLRITRPEPLVRGGRPV